MTLSLRVTRAPAGIARETRALPGGSVTLGRGSDNDWVLPDPDRQLSKNHCAITVRRGRATLLDTSSNGVFINGAMQRVPRDTEVEIGDGDEIALGDYLIVVEEVDAPVAAPQAGRASPDPFGDDEPPPTAGRRDPFDDPFPGAPGGFAHPYVPPSAPALRDPFDVADERAPSHGLDRGSDLFRAPEDDWLGASQKDSADAQAQSYTPPRVHAPPSFDDLDIDALLGDVPPGAPAPAPPAPTPPHVVAEPLHVPDPFEPRPRASDPFGSDEPPRRSVAPPAPAPAPPPVAPHAGDAALLAAFLEGAGAAGARTGDDPEAAMREAGRLFRAMVDGLRQVLISRASVKSEFRVEQTILRTHGNNPLKFSVTTEDAVASLLEPSRPGYQTAQAATEEAFDDVRSHELALMAGVQTALFGLLRRFEPEALEKRLQPNLLGNLVPGARRARMWELFCTTYEEIGREARDDFQAVFGREFARAYDAQARKG